jgi:3-oxoacyl-[acyl-carrier protein] reductase
VVNAAREDGGVSTVPNRTAAGWTVDVTDAGAVHTAVDEVAARIGPPDILVNNGGVSLPAPIHLDGVEQAWDATLAVNLTAYTTLIRACLPHLRRDGQGRIVNVASTEGLGATAFLPPSTAPKHGASG